MTTTFLRRKHAVTLVAAIAVARRVSSEPPEETGSVQAMGVLDVPQKGLLQAEAASGETGERMDAPEPRTQESAEKFAG